MNNPRILVIGDAMRDHYIFGAATRLSAEAPIPVVNVTGDSHTFPGGAANVEANLRSLGADTKLLAGKTVLSTVVCPEWPTKNRLMVGTVQIARWDTYDKVNPIDPEDIDQTCLLFKPDAIIVSDYGKGSIDLNVISAIRDAHLPCYIDTKRSPGIFADIPARTLFPNRVEYAAFKADYDRELSVVVKRSEEGIARLAHGQIRESWPALAKRVVSVCGAGDTVIAAYAFAQHSGYAGSPTSFANRAAAIVVEKPFTATASLEEIAKV